MTISELRALLDAVAEDWGDLEVMLQDSSGDLRELSIAYRDVVSTEYQYPANWNMPVGWQFLRLAD